MSAYKLAGRQRGATIVEAALLVAVVALVSVSGVTKIGTTTRRSYRVAGEAFYDPCNMGPVAPGTGGSRGTCRQPVDKERSQSGK